MRRFKAGVSDDELTLKPLGRVAHRRFVSEIERVFHCNCTVSEKGNLYLQRICAATETETLNPLKILHFFSLYLMPHIKNRYPPIREIVSLTENEHGRGRTILPLGRSQHRVCLVCGNAAVLPSAQFPGRNPDPLYR